jgi:hypothetical protein
MNASLNSGYTAKQVKMTLFQMYPTKAPVLDFQHTFQKHWHLCNNEITKIVIQILNGNDSQEEIKQDIRRIDF